MLLQSKYCTCFFHAQHSIITHFQKWIRSYVYVIGNLDWNGIRDLRPLVRTEHGWLVPSMHCQVLLFWCQLFLVSPAHHSHIHCPLFSYLDWFSPSVWHASLPGLVNAHFTDAGHMATSLPPLQPQRYWLPHITWSHPRWLTPLVCLLWICYSILFRVRTSLWWSPGGHPTWIDHKRAYVYTSTSSF